MEQAAYHSQHIEEFAGNPLIAALPPMMNPEDYPKHLVVSPPYKEEDRYLATGERLNNLQKIAQLHIPTKADSMIMLSISRCLRWGYTGRNPMSEETIQIALREMGIEWTDDLARYLKHINAPIYGFPVLGL